MSAVFALACSGQPEEPTPDAGGPPVVKPCTPLTCETAGVDCGSLLDGCGGVLDCGGCECDAVADCPLRPCETVTACDDGLCTYAPVSCGANACTCASGDCEPEDVRACGEGCAEQYCDPAPLLQNGVVTFQNVCLTRENVRCGLCDLGNYQCQPAGAEPPVACGDVALVGVSPQTAACDGAAQNASILFVDPSFGGNTHDGGRNSPFLTVTEALQVANQRGSRAIIIGGSPTLPHALVMLDGVSVYGGYSSHPNWLPDPARRPVFSVPASALQSGRLVGLVAHDIDTETEVANVDIVTADLTATSNTFGATNAGAHLVNANGLRLRDVRFTVGAGQPGAKGDDAPPAVGNAPKGLKGADATHGPCGSAGPRPGGEPVFATCSGGASPLTESGEGGTNFKPTSSADTGYVAGFAAAQGAQGGLSSFNGTFMLGVGQNGAAYTSPAASGMAGAPSFSFVGSFPEAQGMGDVGANGGMGRGGGGGSSGNRSEYFNTSVNQAYCRIGGGGGSGGAGGCGGLGGAGGHPGGWSVGLVVAQSPDVVLEEVSVVVSAGGEGGPGGVGSQGLPGAEGGPGGAQGVNSDVYRGAPGGDGAAGQQGGTGGQGATGRSVGVLCGAGDKPGITGVTTTGGANPTPAVDCD